MHGDIRDDWKLAEIERKADRAADRLHEVDSLRRDVDRLEHSLRESRAEVDGLRSQLQEIQASVERLQVADDELREQIGKA